MSKKEMEIKIQKMTKILEASLEAIDDFISLDVDTSMCDRYRYNDYQKSNGSLMRFEELFEEVRKKDVFT